MGCGLSKPQGVSRNSHARLEEIHKRARKHARDASLDDPPPNRITRAERLHMGPTSGKHHHTADSSKEPKRNRTHNQPKQIAQGTTAKGESASPSDSKGTETKSRRRRGGKKAAKRRENKKFRERKEAAQRQRDEDLKAAMACNPEQRGSMLGQRVDRASMTSQLRRQSTHERADTERGGKSVYSTGEHKAGSGSGQTRAKAGEKQLPAQAARASGDGKVVRKPVPTEPSNIEIPVNLPAEPKRDRLARERRESKSAPCGSAVDLLHGNGFTPRGRNKKPESSVEKFESDAEPVRKAVKGRKSEDGEKGDWQHGGDTAKDGADVTKSPREDDVAGSKTDNRLSQSSQIDWDIIRERMESKLGKPSSAAPEKSDSGSEHSKSESKALWGPGSW